MHPCSSWLLPHALWALLPALLLLLLRELL
jgi:hypothetical protein